MRIRNKTNCTLWFKVSLIFMLNHLRSLNRSLLVITDLLIISESWYSYNFKYASISMCVDNKQQLLIYCWLNSAILITYILRFDLQRCIALLFHCEIKISIRRFIYFSRFQACLKSFKIPLESTWSLVTSSITINFLSQKAVWLYMLLFSCCRQTFILSLPGRHYTIPRFCHSWFETLFRKLQKCIPLYASTANKPLMLRILLPNWVSLPHKEFHQSCYKKLLQHNLGFNIGQIKIAVWHWKHPVGCKHVHIW